MKIRTSLVQLITTTTKKYYYKICETENRQQKVKSLIPSKNNVTLKIIIQPKITTLTYTQTHT